MQNKGTNMNKYGKLFILISLLAVACAHVNYVGKSFEPTNQVDLYFSKDDIKKEYTVVGHAVGGGVSDNEEIQAALIEEAKAKGADGILITEINNKPLLVEENITRESEIKASFLKYK